MKSNTPFVVPEPPPLNPDVAQITELTGQHATNTRVFNEYRHVELALKKQLIDSVEPLFMAAKKDKVVGFANKTVRELLQHLQLIHEYGAISPAANLMRICYKCETPGIRKHRSKHLSTKSTKVWNMLMQHAVQSR
jgi:hypothetical protein